jgi:hypothetical protein
VKPYSLSRPPSVRITQNGFPSNHLSPSPAPPLRANHLDVAATETINGLEDHIAHLEVSHTQISLELDTTRETLFRERSTRRDSTLSTPSQSPEHHDMFGCDDTLKLLKATRAKNAALSRSLDQQVHLNKSLTDDLEVERFARGAVEEEVKCLKALNMAFSEQNRTFASRAVSPQDFPDLGTTGYYENTLYLLRKDLASIHDELCITKRKLAASDNQCCELRKKVSSLQRSITICVDETAKALDVERELRYEIQARLQDAVEANEDLRSKWSADETLTNAELLTEPWERWPSGIRNVEERVSPGSFSLESTPKETGRNFEEMSHAQQLQRRIAFLAEEVERYKSREVDIGMAQRELFIDVQMKSSAYQVCPSSL